MKKNVASQIIGAQMISATDGSSFTGSVTVYVTGDGGTQAVGSVGSGACTHEGNGFHTYAPSQAETNYDHVAFTFVGTGAVSATLQVYPAFPQTGDAFARLGAPAGASVSEDVAAVKLDTTAILVDTGTTLQAELDDIQADTEDIQTRLPAALVGGRIDASVGAMAANTLTASALATDAVTEIQSGIATATALSTVAGYIDTEIATLQTSVNDLPTNAELATALGTADDAVLSAISALNNLSAAQVNAEVDTALADYDAPTNTEMVAAFTQIKGSTWETTDTLEAIRDRGDAAWTTATGFSTLDAAGVRTAVGLATDNLDAQLAVLPTAAEITDAVWDEQHSDHTTTGSFGKHLNADLNAIEANVISIVDDTNELQTDWANGGRLDTILDARASQSSVDDVPTNAELATALAAADDAILAAIAALNNISASDVNAQVVDALATDTYAELASVPGATATLAEKINWLYVWSRNKITSTASTQTLRNDADSGNIATAAQGDDGTTFTRGEWSS